TRSGFPVEAASYRAKSEDTPWGVYPTACGSDYLALRSSSPDQIRKRMERRNDRRKSGPGGRSTDTSVTIPPTRPTHATPGLKALLVIAAHPASSITSPVPMLPNVSNPAWTAFRATQACDAATGSDAAATTGTPA